jgi:hypothetical protein
MVVRKDDNRRKAIFIPETSHQDIMCQTLLYKVQYN